MLKVIENPSIKHLNTMGIEATARAVVQWEDTADLHEFFNSPRYRDLASGTVKAIGEGSNLLFTVDRYDGTLLVCTGRSVETVGETDDSITLSIGAGLPLDELIRLTTDRHLWGIENLGMIPGTTGAAAVQNVGAYGVDFGDRVSRVTCYDRTDGSDVTLTHDSLGYAYRDSVFKHEPARSSLIISRVEITLSKKPCPVLTYGRLAETVGVNPSPRDVYDAVCATRLAKLPLPSETGSAGSFFKNPVVTAETYLHVRERAEASGIDSDLIPAFNALLPDGSEGYKLSAAWLIDRSGWKGCRRGNVGTWPSQPLVLVNLTGNATGSEIAALAADIAADVQAKWGVTLVPEVEYLPPIQHNHNL